VLVRPDPGYRASLLRSGISSTELDARRYNS